MRDTHPEELKEIAQSVNELFQYLQSEDFTQKTLSPSNNQEDKIKYAMLLDILWGLSVIKVKKRTVNVLSESYQVEKYTPNFHDEVLKIKNSFEHFCDLIERDILALIECCNRNDSVNKAENIKQLITIFYNKWKHLTEDPKHASSECREGYLDNNDNEAARLFSRLENSVNNYTKNPDCSAFAQAIAQLNAEKEEPALTQHSDDAHLESSKTTPADQEQPEASETFLIAPEVLVPLFPCSRSCLLM